MEIIEGCDECIFPTGTRWPMLNLTLSCNTSLLKKSPKQKSDVIYSHRTYMTLVIIKRCRFRTYFLSLNMAPLRLTKVVNGDHIEVNIIHLGISIRLIFSLKRVNKWIWSWIPGSWSKGSDYGKTFWSKKRKPSLKEVMFDFVWSVGDFSTT